MAHDMCFCANGDDAPQENPALRRLLLENFTTSIPD